jgi:DNA repair photolyase
LAGTVVEPEAPHPDAALAQIQPLIEFAGDPRRISLRFDPVVFWKDGGTVRSNLAFFERLAAAAAASGIGDIRMSFAQWYRKARNRASARYFDYHDPPEAEKLSHAEALAAEAKARGLTLFACSQPYLMGVGGIRPSACIDGRRLQELHPAAEPVSQKKDRTQRASCLCTESKDIGSYTQSCPHGCVYCYANTLA